MEVVEVSARGTGKCVDEAKFVIYYKCHLQPRCEANDSNWSEICVTVHSGNGDTPISVFDCLKACFPSGLH